MFYRILSYPCSHLQAKMFSYSITFIKNYHFTCNVLVFAQMHYDFLRKYTQFLQLNLGEESFLCLISVVYSLFRSIAKLKKKMPLWCLKQRESKNFPSKITLMEKAVKHQFQIPRMTWWCPGKREGQKSPDLGICGRTFSRFEKNAQRERIFQNKGPASLDKQDELSPGSEASIDELSLLYSNKEYRSY